MNRVSWEYLYLSWGLGEEINSEQISKQPIGIHAGKAARLRLVFNKYMEYKKPKPTRWINLIRHNLYKY